MGCLILCFNGLFGLIDFSNEDKLRNGFDRVWSKVSKGREQIIIITANYWRATQTNQYYRYATHTNINYLYATLPTEIN
jgi:hypothetical protein